MEKVKGEKTVLKYIFILNNYGNHELTIHQLTSIYYHDYHNR